jgi:hypothetical protein
MLAMHMTISGREADAHDHLALRGAPPVGMLEFHAELAPLLTRINASSSRLGASIRRRLTEALQRAVPRIGSEPRPSGLLGLSQLAVVV